MKNRQYKMEVMKMTKKYAMNDQELEIVAGGAEMTLTEKVLTVFTLGGYHVGKSIYEWFKKH